MNQSDEQENTENDSPQDPTEEALRAASAQETLQNDSHVWETRLNLGYFYAFLTQVKEMILRPSSVFCKIDPKSSIWESLTYGLQVTILGVIPVLLWHYVRTGSLSVSAQSQPESGLMVVQIAWFFLPAVLMALVNIFLSAGLAHGVLKITGDVEQPYGAAVKVFSYSQTATLANVVPYIGRLVGGIWGIVLSVEGVKQLYGVSKWRAIGAAVVPIVAIILIIAVFVALGPQIAAMG